MKKSDSQSKLNDNLTAENEKRAMNADELDMVSGGYSGRDQYDEEQYRQAGIRWVHSTGKKDRYYYTDPKTGEESETNQATATFLTGEYYKKMGVPFDDEITYRV